MRFVGWGQDKLHAVAERAAPAQQSPAIKDCRGFIVESRVKLAGVQPSGASAVTWHAHVQTVPHADEPVGAGAFPATTIAAAPQLRAIPHATAADATAAMRIGPGANMAASAAVIGIGIQDAALAVARHRPLDASVETRAADALAEFKGTRVGAAETATAAVVEVVFQIGAIISATRLSINAAIVAAGSAVRVGSQVAACTVACRGGTTGVIAA